MPVCDICNAFVARRKNLAPYFPGEATNAAMACQECYGVCMAKCEKQFANIPGARSEVCHKKACWPFYYGSELAKSQLERQRAQGAKAAATSMRTLAKAGYSSAGKYLPAPPMSDPALMDKLKRMRPPTNEPAPKRFRKN
jgi:hypothetical protein